MGRPERAATENTAERLGATGILDALRSGGQVGQDLLAVDWSATPLGPPEAWPNALRTVVRVLLSSRFSMWMAWGPELTFFCNDAYRRDTLGTKYPWALARPAREVWAEIWEDIGPRIEGVLATGEATWDESLLLFLERSGYVEETYHTFSYSPLTDDAGAIAGMLCVVTEDTERIIGERRMATLRHLGSEPLTGRDDHEYLRAAARHLEANQRSLAFTLVYLFDEGTGGVKLASATGIEIGHPAAPPEIEPHASEPWPVGKLSHRQTVVVEDIDRKFDALPTGAWQEAPRTAVVLPLLQAVTRGRPYGFLVVGVNRYRPLDDGYRSFLRLVAAQLASGIASARAYEAERARAEQLAELDRAKTAFFTNVSHELRTPLTLLLGPAEDALADGAGVDRQRMEMIARNGQRLLKLVNTLLDFSRLESGRGHPTLEPVELAEYTAELASMFQSTVERAGLRLQIDCPPLPAPVYVDKEMWAKIVLNLLSNALKFTFTGAISVAVAQAGEFARLAVTDTGVGIEPAEQGRLFERFHRVPGTRARTYEGSGIGLALVAELAQLHGGRTGVKSVLGSGSTFTVEVPFGPPADLEQTGVRREVAVEREVAGFVAEADRWVRAPLDGGARTEPRLQTPDGGPRVLVVDDNADMRDYVASLLAGEYRVNTAADGVEALQLAKAEPPDLVLTDVMMPRLDGFGLLKALREDPETLPVPVVMLSARAGEEGVIEGLEAGADDYLVKPFSARELLARVRANLELDRAKRTRDELQRSQSLQDQAERLAQVGSWEIDLASGLMRGSDQLLRMLGMSRPEFESLPYEQAIAQVVHPHDRELVRSGLEDAITTGEPFGHDVRLLAPGGERWVRTSGEAVADEHGELTLLRGFVQDITQQREAEQAIAAAAAAREAAAREHQIADELQRSLLPPERFHSPQLEVVTYYQAGVKGTRIGGDWTDVIDLGAGRTAVVIGDVTGRGVQAATLMGQLRAAARSYAHLDLQPAELLERLDEIVWELGAGRLVTCIYGVFDPAVGAFRYANAGHPAPLLAVPGEPTRRLSDATGPLLGVGSARFTERFETLGSGSLIMLYTDGLIERRDRDLDASIDMLATRVHSEAPGVSELVNELVQSLAPEGSADDIAILMARIADRSGQQTAVLEVPPTDAGIREGRSFTTARLSEWSLQAEVIEDATLIVSELLTNAAIHGRSPIRLRLRTAANELVIEVYDGASALPRKLRVSPEEIRGRGLAIVAALSHRWAARGEGHGKTVWSTLKIPSAAE